MSTQNKTKVFSWLKNIQHMLLPGVCILCKSPSGRAIDLCQNCQHSLKTIARPCASCALPLPDTASPGMFCGRCLLGTNPYQQAQIPFHWQAPVSTLISQFKYQRKLHVGRVLATLLKQQIIEQYPADGLPRLLIPVPLHLKKLRSRGFNQSLLITRQLSHDLSIPLAEQLVVRQRHTAAQQTLTAAQRRHNLSGAFALSGSVPEQDVQPSCIAIIDDVVTTMSTVQALARVLKPQLPAHCELHLWALARA